MQREEKRLLLFALRYPQGWHTAGRDCHKTMRRLAEAGFLEIAWHPRPALPQFRLNLPEIMRHSAEIGTTHEKES